MDRSLEVRVRTGVSVLFVAVAGIGLSLGTAAAAQTATAPVTQQTAPPQSEPPPTPVDPNSIDSEPAYGQKPVQSPETLPVPQPAPPPVVTSAPPTPQTPYTAMPAYAPEVVRVRPPGDPLGSAYIPLDSWMYPAMVRLYSMGYLGTMNLSMRPYTRRSALHILQKSEDAILSSDDEQAQDILAALLNELSEEGITSRALSAATRGTVYGVQSVYARVLGLTGSILQDSFHLGQTFYNDYGRPEEPGFNMITGFSTLAEHGRFSLYVRGEYQHAPSGPGYSQPLGAQLSALEEIVPFAPPNNPQDTIPTGPIAGQNPFRLVEATLSYHILGHEISGGKSDAWLGPGMGGAMAWSNNAENIYSFRINRVEPLYIPFVSKLMGPLRYDFFYGSLKGHTATNNDWVHSEMFSFQPTPNFQFAFQRTIVFGGAGHQPVTLHTFLKGFFSINDTTIEEKYSRDDPGARFSDFSFSWRLPFLRKYLTLYTDSETHDDVTPISAPRRAGYRPGIYLSQFPRAKKLSLRVEGVSTDCATLVCQGGSNQYTETIHKQAYTNKGLIMGDWIGREAKGGQAWLTYHLSGNEWVDLQYLYKKTPKDFIAGGTTQHQFRVDVVKRIGPNVEINGWYQYEHWKAPIYLPGAQGNNTVTVQVTFFPKLKTTAP
jgi:hypothetical protein